MTDIVIDIKDERLILMPERAAYWEGNRTLFVADLHLGKIATFRAHGILLPEGSMAADLQRLTQALTRSQAATLVILGDMIHAAKGRDKQTLLTFSQWRNQHPDIEIILVRGNHDQRAGDPPAEWDIQCVDAPMVKPSFTLSHLPCESTDTYVLSGHIHPAVQLTGKGRQTLKLPCFRFGTTSATLPAFGSFIDHTFIKPLPDERIYVVTSTQVLAL